MFVLFNEKALHLYVEHLEKVGPGNFAYLQYQLDKHVHSLWAIWLTLLFCTIVELRTLVDSCIRIGKFYVPS